MKYSFNTLLISSLCLISASRGVSAQTTQPSKPNQAVSPYSNPMGALINSPTITDSTADWKSKAQSTVDSLPTAVGPSLLPSKEMTNTATFNLSVTQEKQKAALAVQEASTEGNLLDKVKARLPREVNSVKFGAHITVSPQGAEVIDNIRALATAKGEIQNTLLSAIANAAKSGVPEAENFVGLIYEIGANRENGKNRALRRFGRAYRPQTIPRSRLANALTLYCIVDIYDRGRSLLGKIKDVERAADGSSRGRQRRSDNLSARRLSPQRVQTHPHRAGEWAVHRPRLRVLQAPIRLL